VTDTTAGLPANPVVGVSHTTAGPTGSIYDIGYRRYEGPRLGRGHAVRSLFLHSLRSAFGIGRGGRAKIAPIILGGMAVLPAIAIVGALTMVAQFGVGNRFATQAPIRYDTYFGTISTVVVLFCAAQAPELFGRDQRHGVLALYFARALRRTDYALARIGGFVAAILILQLLPNIILFLGRVLLSEDIPGAVVDDLPSIPPVLAQAVLASLLLGGLSMAVSAFTPRRAYATAGIIALFTIPNIVAGIVAGLGSSALGTWLILLSPTSVLDGTNSVFFNKEFGSDFFFVDLPDIAFVLAALAGVIVSIGLAVRRFARVAT
jgi:ABC-2 type transport system permease protein